LIDKPKNGRLYHLTGKQGDKCIANGNTWEESEYTRAEYKAALGFPDNALDEFIKRTA
tara:strand:+ start:1512 stop:1685 length:174 start_codon:yes stop_codon:yes gene_type:complete